jgi:hypothetical protein
MLLCTYSSNRAVARTPSYGSSSLPNHFPTHVFINHFRCFGLYYSTSNFVYLFVGHSVQLYSSTICKSMLECMDTSKGLFMHLLITLLWHSERVRSNTLSMIWMSNEIIINNLFQWKFSVLGTVNTDTYRWTLTEKRCDFWIRIETEEAYSLEYT